MSELKEKLKDICEMREILEDWTKEEFGKGKECICTDEMGKVVDMIKDFAEAEKDIVKACYYKKIVEAMDDAEEEEELMAKVFAKMDHGEDLNDHERMGYDHWRYSSGRFAPKGHGHRSGYTPWGPPTYLDPVTAAEDWDTYGDGRMGYGGRYSSGSRSTSMSGRAGYTPMDEFRMARKHYTETHSSEDKEKMNEHAKHHMEESIDTMKEIWRTADPDLKKKMKSDISSFLNEMN